MSDFNVLTSVTSLPYGPATAGKPVLFDPASKRYHVPESPKESFHLKLHGWRCATELADTAYTYARYFVKGRWPKGEPTIATDLDYAFLYAKTIIKGKWPEGEAAILKSPRHAYYYAEDVTEGRWLEGEPIIASHLLYGRKYAKRFNLHYDEENQRFIEK